MLESGWMERRKSSGICPRKAIILMFGPALVLSLIVGIVAHYLGAILGWIGNFSLESASDIGKSILKPEWRGIWALAWIGMTAAMSLVLYLLALAIFLVYPFIIGFITGEIVGRFGKRGHCRNSKIAGWAGVTSSIFIYIGHSVINLLSYSKLHPMTINVEMLENAFPSF